MRIAIATLLALACLSTAPASGSNFAPGPAYWPLDWANMYAYKDDSDRWLYVTVLPWWPSQSYRQESRCVTEAGQEWMTIDMFNIDALGDVYLTSFEHVDGAGVAQHWDYSPPLKFIDSPISVGDSWTNSGTAVGVATEIFQHSCVVERAETVTVPIGTFETLVLVETDLQNTHHEGTYYLARDSNPIMLPGGFKLQYVHMIIGVESTSWGSVKALFR